MNNKLFLQIIIILHIGFTFLISSVLVEMFFYVGLSFSFEG